ncbi:MAG: hypothetical protein IJ617_07655 [Oscillospiraceae bacterium]|nr:hypothetical protein [Oscillospiraceae bacterium]
MTETKQKPELNLSLSLVGRLRKMAGAADMTFATQQGEPPVVLPDGYRRRSPVQRSVRRAKQISRRTLVVLSLLAAALLVAGITVVLIKLF